MATRDNVDEGMRAEAIAIVQASVERLLKDEDDDDLKWLPEDFGEVIAAMAWEHQFDIDGTVFRRKLDRYLTDISKEAAK